MDQEFERGLAGYSGSSRTFFRLQTGCQQGLKSSEGLSGAGRLFSWWAFTWLLARGFSSSVAPGRRAQFFAMWTSSQGCLSILTKWQLVFHQQKWWRESRQGREWNAFDDLVSEVRYHHLCHILFITNQSLNLDPTQGEKNWAPHRTGKVVTSVTDIFLNYQACKEARVLLPSCNSLPNTHGLGFPQRYIIQNIWQHSN